jgi:hypothetical protein
MALAEVLLAPLTDVSARFEAFAGDAAYRAYADGSIISLQHHIKRVLGINVFIENTPGGDTDFLVMLNTAGADPKRVRDFVNRYRIAGTSFDVQSSPLTAEFIDHRCERVNYTAAFIGHVCEMIEYRIAFVNHTCERMPAVFLEAEVYRSTSTSLSVEVKTSGHTTVKSRLNVETQAYFIDNGTWIYRNVTVILPSGSSSGYAEIAGAMDRWVWAGCGIAGITPAMDDYYVYLRPASEYPTVMPTPTPTPVPTPEP